MNCEIAVFPLINGAARNTRRFHNRFRYAGGNTHLFAATIGDLEMTIRMSANSMFANSMSANLTLARARSDGPSASEGKIAKVVHKLLMDHSIDRTFYLQDDLREVGLTSLDMASLVLSVEAEFDLMIPERDITPANFRSVSTITSLVTRLMAPRVRVSA